MLNNNRLNTTNISPMLFELAPMPYEFAPMPYEFAPMSYEFAPMSNVIAMFSCNNNTKSIKNLNI